MTVIRRATGPVEEQDGFRMLCNGVEWVVRFERPINVDTGIGTVESMVWTMWDHRLRPIRNPGDDARDETLEWLPVPSTTKEAA